MNKNICSYLKLGVFTAFFIIVDQLTKYWATICLKGKNDVSIIKDALVLHYLDGGNTGAAWGLLSGKRTMFLVFTVLAVIIICIFIRNLQNHKTNYSLKPNKFVFLQYLFALLMAGAIGNFIDRTIHGYVIDFIYFKLINFPIFNVADCYVTVSCVIILIICLFKIDEDEFNNIFTLKSKKVINNE